jgi:type II secretory pathway pseudopilin PulG
MAMNVRTAIPLLTIVALASVGCKKSSTSGANSALAGAPVADSAEADKLWALAPKGAVMSAVITGRGATVLWNGVTTFRELTKDIPSVGAAIAKVYGDAMTELTGNADGSLADAGLAPGASAAFTVGKDHMLLVLPVIDRDKFVAAVHGKRAADAKAGIDEIDSMYCAMKSGFYMCAQPQALLDQVGTASLVGKTTVVGARGDIEIVVDLDAAPNLFGIKGIGVATVQLGNGQFLVQGIAPRGPNPIVFDRNVEIGTTNAAGFMYADVMPLMKSVAPPEAMAKISQAGFDGRASMVIPAGRLDVDGRLQLTDAKMIAELISHCDQLPVPPQVATLTPVDGGCKFASTQYGAAGMAWLQDNQLRFAKSKGDVAPGIALPVSALGALLKGGNWNAAMWGRGFALQSNAEAQMAMMPPGTDPAMLTNVFRALATFSEIGFGVEVRPDNSKFAFGMRTVFSNPPELVAELNRAVDTFVANKFDGSAFAGLAAKYPKSDFASDYASGAMGMTIPTALVGILAAVAVPAFTDYMSKGKKSEAELELNVIGKNSKDNYIADAHYIVGSTPMTPAQSCCELNDQGKRKCPAKPEFWADPTWQALDFQIDDPHYFRYQYTGTATRYKAIAVGDLDCDGTEVTYTLEGSSDNGIPTAKLTFPTNMD